MSAYEFYNNRLYRDFDIDTFAGTLIFAQDYADHCLKEAEQRIAELEANLVRYGDHEVIDGQFACASLGSKQPCNCGFEAALARLREVKHG